MPIKQLQLRGISRTPSDRASADGGCAESLNVHIEEQETAPTLPAKDITNDYCSNASSFMDGPALFIHKGPDYENLLFVHSGAIVALPKSEQAAQSVMPVYTLKTNEEVLDITNVGNTLMICTNQRMEYVLYKQGAYKDLGDQIPIPLIEFQTREYYTQYNIPSTAYEIVGLRYADTERVLIESYTPGTDDYNGIITWNTNVWNRVLEGASTATEADIAAYEEVNAKVWEMIQMQLPYVKKEEGCFGAPFFARYALRLYDGTYIYQSVPILIGGGTAEFIKVYGEKYIPTGSTTWKSIIRAYLTMAYKVKAYLKEISYTGWEDIVKSIDLFITTDIYLPSMHSKITGITSETLSESAIKYPLSFDDDAEGVVAFDKLKNEFLSKSIFYKIDSFDINNLTRLTDGYDMLTQDELIASQDILQLQDELPDDYQSAHKKMAENIFKYNDKVILTGISQLLTSGYSYLNGSVVRAEFTDTANQNEDEYSFKFFLHGPSNEDLIVFGRDDNGGTIFDPYSQTVTARYIPTSQEFTHYAKPMAWIAYPDARCYKVYVKRVTNGVTSYWSYPMEPHPRLNCSYCFFGIDKQLAKHTTSSGLPGSAILQTEYESKQENNLYQDKNVIWASLISNPFVFPAAGRMTFYSKVISLANATRALSEGQFGQFPLYVFTEDGIWSVPITGTGDFAASVPVSRDVAVSRRAIQNLEQEIVFVTEQSVMVIEGSSITNISPNMNGRHYVLDEEIIQLLSNSEWADLSAIENDSETFMSFVKNSTIGYDYAGQRLIFFRNDKPSQYVYYIRTQTWHKILAGGNDFRVLNGYPECVVSSQKSDESGYQLLNFSTILDDADAISDTANPIKGLIITRPFDLGEPDIRKAIRDIRVRGMFNRDDVKYILLGSFDNVHWKRLHSLRGGSYKFFRMILLCNLSPTERITWVDVDYESRFANKLR